MKEMCYLVGDDEAVSVITPLHVHDAQIWKRWYWFGESPLAVAAAVEDDECTWKEMITVLEIYTRGPTWSMIVMMIIGEG